MCFLTIFFFFFVFSTLSHVEEEQGYLFVSKNHQLLLFEMKDVYYGGPLIWMLTAKKILFCPGKKEKKREKRKQKTENRKKEKKEERLLTKIHAQKKNKKKQGKASLF